MRPTWRRSTGVGVELDLESIETHQCGGMLTVTAGSTAVKLGSSLGRSVNRRDARP
jgi:hydroxymethylpyrimidine/phosphomethylpyrimidine kinase